MPATELQCKHDTYVRLTVVNGLIWLGTGGADFHDDAHLSAQGARRLAAELVAYAERLEANH